MILSIGEILADIFMDEAGNMSACVGGAPFNVAVGAKKSGARTMFVGRVGNDPIGTFVKKSAYRFPIECVIQTDSIRPTTMAFVSIDEKGERNFKFIRHDSADYCIEIGNLFIETKPYILHMGSLMLSEQRGVELANNIVDFCDKTDTLLSFDVNYRDDIFNNKGNAYKAYMPYILRADILKFSKEEIEMFFEEDYISALKKLNNKIICVTCGKDGSVVKIGHRIVFAKSKPVIPIDTTGAGDAFFGTFLAGIDKYGIETLDENAVLEVAIRANEKGAEATLHKGAVLL